MKKKFLFFAAFALIFTGAFSQDATKMRPADRFIFGLFTDVWSNLPSDMETNTINRGISIDYIQEFPISTSNFSVAAGLGFASHNLYSDYWYMRDFDNNVHSFTSINDELDYSNNKLSLNYINIPVEFRYRTRNTSRTFRIHAGIKGGLLINAHTKYVGEDAPNGRETKYKEGKLDNIETFLLGFQGRIGYGRVNLNTFISLTDIFSDNNASNAEVMSLGVSFIIF